MTAAEDCAREILDVVPEVMRDIRLHMRSHREADLSLTEFRALAYLGRHRGASLSDLAEYIGLGLPSMSKVIDQLAARGLVSRQEDATDRRRLALCLTQDGEIVLGAALAATEAHLAAALAVLSPGEQATVGSAMQILRPLFAANC
jgi:DNA-binding MarR family transcriptional regulator